MHEGWPLCGVNVSVLLADNVVRLHGERQMSKRRIAIETHPDRLDITSTSYQMARLLLLATLICGSLLTVVWAQESSQPGAGHRRVLDLQHILRQACEHSANTFLFRVQERKSFYHRWDAELKEIVRTLKPTDNLLDVYFHERPVYSEFSKVCQNTYLLDFHVFILQLPRTRSAHR